MVLAPAQLSGLSSASIAASYAQQPIVPKVARIVGSALRHGAKYAGSLGSFSAVLVLEAGMFLAVDALHFVAEATRFIEAEHDIVAMTLYHTNGHVAGSDGAALARTEYFSGVLAWATTKEKLDGLLKSMPISLDISSPYGWLAWLRDEGRQGGCLVRPDVSRVSVPWKEPERGWLTPLTYLALKPKADCPNVTVHDIVGNSNEPRHPNRITDPTLQNPCHPKFQQPESHTVGSVLALTRTSRIPTTGSHILRWASSGTPLHWTRH